VELPLCTHPRRALLLSIGRGFCALASASDRPHASWHRRWRRCVMRRARTWNPDGS